MLTGIGFHGSVLSSHSHHYHLINARIDDYTGTENAYGVIAWRCLERITVSLHVALGDRARWTTDNVGTYYYQALREIYNECILPSWLLLLTS